MKPGRLVGRAILVGLDALAAAALAGVLAFLLVPIVWVGDRVLVAIIAAGIVGGLTLAIALALAGLGKRPFAATRVARTALDRLPLWV